MTEGIDSKYRSKSGGPGRASRVAVLVFTQALALLFAVSGCSGSDDSDASTKVNGSIHVPAGKEAGAVATVNGSIQIDDNAAVTSATTVNGSVHLGDHATADVAQQRERLHSPRRGCACVGQRFVGQRRACPWATVRMLPPRFPT